MSTSNTLEARIHHGALEVGGSCVELRCGTDTLFLDAGEPLDGMSSLGESAVRLSDRADPLGVLVTHGHRDHCGRVPEFPASVPRWIGHGAADILRAARFWGAGCDLGEAGHYRDRETFVLMMEGTNIASDRPENITTESDVERDLVATIEATEGPVVVLSSPQNIDRLVSVYRAARRTGRDLAVDLYTADVMDAAHRPSIPKVSPEWPHVRVLATDRQRVRVRDSGEFHRVAERRHARIYADSVIADPARWVLFGAFTSQLERWARADILAGGCVVWSMWDGNLDSPRNSRMVRVLEGAGVPFVHHHTSGHASAADLRRLERAIGADRLMPIHTDAPHLFASHVDTVVGIEEEGTWWAV